MSTCKKRSGDDYHHGDLRRALIESAARMAARDGLKVLSLRRLAAEVGVSASAAYHHFNNKADLLAAVAEEGFTRLGEVIGRIESQHAGAEARVRFQKMGVAYVQFAVSHPHYFGVMFRPEIAQAFEPPPDGMGHQLFLRLIAVVQEMRGERGEPSQATMHRVLLAWSAVHGLAALWIDGRLSMAPPFAGWGIDQLAEIVTVAVARIEG